MGNSSESLDKWREYFRSANSDIFDIIEHSIMVAACDCPYELKLKRDRIAEMLFTCKVKKCYGCDKVELSVPKDDDDGDDGDMEKMDDKCKSGIDAGGSKDTKESKVNLNQVRNYSYGDAEALTDEIEEESQLYAQVSRIKQILDNSEDESDSFLFDSLRRLQLMPLSLETLKATEIGKSVNALRKHGSKEIRNLVRILIEDWKVMVDEWAAATATITAAEVATESVKTSVVEEDEEEEEEGLPSPPLDEGAFFATPSSMELSQFFDGMDDDGNPRNSEEFNKNHENGRKPTMEKPNIPRPKNQVSYDSSSTPPEYRKAEAVMKKQSCSIKPNKPPTGESGPGRPKLNIERRVNNEIKVQRKPDKTALQRRPLPQQDKSRGNDEASVRTKLEAAKRKLHERYQEAENAKKQRTVQVVGFQDLPKENLVRKNQPTRPGNNRSWANGRR